MYNIHNISIAMYIPRYDNIYRYIHASYIIPSVIMYIYGLINIYYVGYKFVNKIQIYT